MNEQSQIQLSTRGDRETAMIRAYIVGCGDDEEIASLSMVLAEFTPGLFEAWFKMITDSVESWAKAQGFELEGEWVDKKSLK